MCDFDPKPTIYRRAEPFSQVLVHEGKVKISGADRDRDNPKKDLAKQAWVKACIQPMQRMGEKRFVPAIL